MTERKAGGVLSLIGVGLALAVFYHYGGQWVFAAVLAFCLITLGFEMNRA